MCALATGQSRAIAGQGYGSMFVIRECFAVALAARILGLASIWARWVATRGWMLLDAVALGIALPGIVATSGDPAHAGVTLEERKMPMKFSWVAD